MGDVLRRLLEWLPVVAVVVLLETERLPPALTLDLARRLGVRLVTLQPVE